MMKKRNNFSTAHRLLSMPGQELDQNEKRIVQ